MKQLLLLLHALRKRLLSHIVLTQRYYYSTPLLRGGDEEEWKPQEQQDRALELNQSGRRTFATLGLPLFRCLLNFEPQYTYRAMFVNKAWKLEIHQAAKPRCKVKVEKHHIYIYLKQRI